MVIEIDMEDLRQGLITYLKGFSELRKLHKDAGSELNWPRQDSEVIYEHGCLMEKGRVVLPKRTVKPESRECYFNAWKLYKRRKGLRYCEGYIGLDGCPIPVMHGWCIDKAGMILDPSVEQDRKTVYYGVVFKNEFTDRIWPELRRKGAIGIFGNMWRIRTITWDVLLANIENVV